MKLTYAQLIASVDALNRFAANAFPIRTSIAMKDILRRVDVLVSDYNQERLARCQQFGTLNNETNSYDFENGDQAKWQEAMTELHGGEVEIHGERIRLNGLLSSMTISPADLFALEWLIDDGAAG